MSLHPTMAAYLAPFAPPSSDVHKFAEQAMPGVEVRDATHADFVDSMAGDLELVPTEQDEFTAKLARAGFSVPVSARSENKRLQEDAAIAADLAYQRLKDTGQLRRDEDHRALVAQVQFGDAL